MTAAKNKIAVIIVAAGASSRLGNPKQLLPFAGKKLLQHVLQVSIDSVADPVIVVLGASADQIIREVNFTSAQVVVNDNWPEGMASSIRCGIKTLVETDPYIEGAIIMLCDQPHVTTALLDNLVSVYLDTASPIVASEYNAVLGAPAFFHKNIFPELLLLTGDVGAKVIIQQNSKHVATVAFTNGSVDIDTAADYQALLKDRHLQ